MPVIRKEDVDFARFVPEVETYLVNIRDGSPGGEQEALLRTLREFPHLTSASITSWSRDPEFAQALDYARAAGDQAREYDRQMAAQREENGDPFRDPPARGGFDPYAIAEGSSARGAGPTAAPPRQGIRHWLKGWRRLATEAEAAKAAAEAVKPEPESDPLAQRFVSLEDAPYWAPAQAAQNFGGSEIRTGSDSATERACQADRGWDLHPPECQPGE